MLRDVHCHVSQLSSSSIRMANIVNEGAYDVLDRATRLEREQGRSIVHLELGQPSFRTPEHVVQTAVDNLKRGNTKYTSPSGTNELKIAICEYYNGKRQDSKVKGIEKIDPTNVVIGPGAKPGLFFALMALVNPGDAVIYPSPGFPSYSNSIHACQGECVPVRLNKSQDGLDLDVLCNELEKAKGRVKVEEVADETASSPTVGPSQRPTEVPKV